MVSLSELWLPIVLSAVFVFVVSSVIHMVVQFHKNDLKKLPNEDKVLDALRSHGVAPGQYQFPGCHSMKEMSSPEMVAKLQKGPLGSMILLAPGGISIGRSLFQWFLYSLLLGVFTAYIGHLGLDRGANYLKVFQLTGAAAVGMYAFANIPDSIWKGLSWGTTLKFVIDGVLYGLVTGGTFGWLWPKG